MKRIKNHSKTDSGYLLRCSTLTGLERPLAVRFTSFCLKKRKLLGDMDKYYWLFCRAYEAERLHLRLKWNAMGMLLEHEPF